MLLPDDGVVLTEKLASLLGVSAGDTFTLDGDSRVQVRVADVTEHYIMHYVYMTDAYYQTLYGQPPEENQVLAAYPAEGAEALDAELVGLDGVTTLSQVAATREVFTSSLESVDYARGPHHRVRRGTGLRGALQPDQHQHHRAHPGAGYFEGAGLL